MRRSLRSICSDRLFAPSGPARDRGGTGRYTGKSRCGGSQLTRCCWSEHRTKRGFQNGHSRRMKATKWTITKLGENGQSVSSRYLTRNYYHVIIILKTGEPNTIPVSLQNHSCAQLGGCRHCSRVRGRAQAILDPGGMEPISSKNWFQRQMPVLHCRAHKRC